MNHRIASAITYSSTVAVATIAAAFLSTNAYADDPTIDLMPSTSTSGSALRGTYDSSVDLWGLSGQYRF